MRTARAFANHPTAALWGSRSPLKVEARHPDEDRREICRGVWRCTVSAETAVSVIRKRQLNAPVCIVVIGLGMVILGLLTQRDPVLMIGGAIWTAIGIDSYTRVKTTNIVRLREGAAVSEVMISQDNELAMEFVEDITATVATLKELRDHELNCGREAVSHAKAG
jgi:hypothetical protein